MQLLIRQNISLGLSFRIWCPDRGWRRNAFLWIVFFSTIFCLRKAHKSLVSPADQFYSRIDKNNTTLTMDFVGTTISIPLANTKTIDAVIAPKRIARMQRRHSLTLDYRQEEDDAELVEEDMLVISQAPVRELFRQPSTCSEPLMYLGDLASLLMPPKIVKTETKARPTSTKRYQRRGSCSF